ncbi:MAG: hypothetical protein RIE86_04935 [Imperialibacter sp.]|uniref:hypothetical protein n=1 Tax=Imperialibacter sp. TaxID=2038411 RepID=UPI0032ED6AA7
MNTTRITPQKFSEYFKLPKGVNFDFVDIYAFQDIALFLDPYGISSIGSKWARDCENQIATYFQYLIDSIRTGDKKTTARLLGAFHEVDEVALGYSTGEPSGRGIGSKQAKEIQLAFESSAAAKSGDIKDIADCALMIPGINRDKISDITANILKKKLIEFTQLQCKKYSIPLSRVAVNNAFDYDKFDFISYFDELPLINGKPKILLPISAVRQDPELSKDKYYRNFVIEFLKAEHQHAGDALASVLKNGKVVVRIADLKQHYPLRVEFLYEFSKQHPAILDKYKSELRRTAANGSSRPRLETKRKILNSTERLQILSSIKTGNDDASNFHKISFDNLIHIFDKRLSNPNREKEINEGRKRIDIVFDNNDKKGFFHQLNSLHHVQCPKIFVECKNYGKEIGNPEVDQLLGRFSITRGKFGILLCRSIDNRKMLIRRCKDVFNDHQSFIIVLDDSDIIALLEFRDHKQENKIDQFMKTKLDQIIM